MLCPTQSNLIRNLIRKFVRLQVKLILNNSVAITFFTESVALPNSLDINFVTDNGFDISMPLGIWDALYVIISYIWCWECKASDMRSDLEISIQPLKTEELQKMKAFTHSWDIWFN